MNAIIPDTLQGALILSLIDFLLSFVVISFIGVALAGFPLINRVASRITRRRGPPSRATRPAAPAPAPGIPTEHVAAIAAAVAASMGPARIVHIEAAAHDSTWVYEGRRSQHLSHAPRNPAIR